MNSFIMDTTRPVNNNGQYIKEFGPYKQEVKMELPSIKMVVTQIISTPCEVVATATTEVDEEQTSLDNFLKTKKKKGQKHEGTQS